MPNHETSTYSNTSVCGGTAGERAARLLGSRSPPTPCVPFAEEFQPYTKSKSNIGRWVRILFTATWL